MPLTCVRLHRLAVASQQWCLSTTLRPATRSQGCQRPLPRNNTISLTANAKAGFERNFFCTYASRRRSQQEEEKVEKTEKSLKRKKKGHRASVGESSLRRVAVEAQRSKDGSKSITPGEIGGALDVKTVTAVAAADQYDIAKASHILQSKGYRLDPYGTNLYPQVIHLEIPTNGLSLFVGSSSSEFSDVLIFPSGTVVAWDLDEDALSDFVEKLLSSAAEGPRQMKLEQEDLDYVVDPQRENSSIKNDSIVLGTKPSSSDSSITARLDGRDLDTVLAKIAFSSGLARSTKLSVLETLLEHYFETTKEITQRLSQGGRLPSSRSAILQKTGQLLSIRAKLNLYSELTDSLPDLFWDSKQELGLEGYFDQVGRVLDTKIRIKTLNERMDYAQEIASVLRQQLSENHSVRLEWIIIVLIMIEVAFNIWQEVKEHLKENWTEDNKPTTT